MAPSMHLLEMLQFRDLFLGVRLMLPVVRSRVEHVRLLAASAAVAAPAGAAVQDSVACERNAA